MKYLLVYCLVFCIKGYAQEPVFYYHFKVFDNDKEVVETDSMYEVKTWSIAGYFQNKSGKIVYGS